MGTKSMPMDSASEYDGLLETYLPVRPTMQTFSPGLMSRLMSFKTNSLSVSLFVTSQKR